MKIVTPFIDGDDNNYIMMKMKKKKSIYIFLYSVWLFIIRCRQDIFIQV